MAKREADDNANGTWYVEKTFINDQTFQLGDTSEKDRCDINWIPPHRDNSMQEYLHNEDVLIRIFKLLPSTDRKNVRRTCKLWSKVCFSPSVTAGEKLVFRPNCDDFAIANLLRNLTHFASIDLEFQDQPIARIPDNVWKTCGSKIRGLHFYRCHHFERRCMINVIESCKNLRDFNINESGKSLDEITLSYFIKNKIKREMVSSFSLRYWDDTYLDADLLRKIFIVFPKILHFTTGNAPATPIPEFNEVHRTLVPPESLTQLKSFVYLHNLCFNGEHWLRAPMIPLSRLRLKKFETTLNHTTSGSVNSLKQTLFEFIEAQEELEIINLRMVCGPQVSSPSGEWESFIKELIFHVLNRCRNLREFRLFDWSYVLLSKEETAHFFACVAKLKCLVITQLCLFLTLVPSPLALSSPSRFAINTLMVESDTKEFEMCILRQCSLKHLRIGELSDELLQEILTTQPDLRTLVLDDIQDCGSALQNSFNLSISALRRLEYLEINERKPYKFTKKILNEIRWPSLKHLKIDVHSYNMPEKLSKIAPNLPALEVLELSTLSVGKWKDIIGVSRLLRNLRRLSVHFVKKPESVELLQLFRECPNLRCVIQIGLNNVYLFNPFTEQISESSLNGVRFPQIDELYLMD